jgi:hypothetical protein
MDSPVILCVSRVYRGPRERLEIERRGARMVYLNSNFEPILQEVDFLLAEAAASRANGPRIQILYCLRDDGIEVAMAFLVHRSRLYPVRLASRGRILLDHLARHRLPQSAAQIQASIRSDSFYSSRVFDGGGTRRPARRLSHVKVYIKRIREALAQAFQDAGIDSVDPRKVLISEPANGSTVLYSLRCSVEWTYDEHSG